MSGQWNAGKPPVGGVSTGRVAVIVAAGVGAVLVAVLVVATIGMAGGSENAGDDSASASESQEGQESRFDGDYRIVFGDEDEQCLALSEQGDGEDRWVMAMRGCDDEPTDFTVASAADGVVAIGFAHEAWDGQCLAPDGPPADALNDSDPADIWYFAPYECEDDSVPFNFQLREAGDDTYHLETAAQQCLGVSEDDEFQDGLAAYTMPCDQAKPLRFEEL